MTDLEIVEIDPHDDTALEAWHEVYLASDVHERPFATPWWLPEVKATVRTPSNSHRFHLYSALRDGEVVAIAMAEYSLKDNLTQGEVMLGTRPGLGRQGYASAVLHQVEADLVALRRTTLIAMTDYEYDAGLEGTGVPGVEFLRKHGFSFGLGDVQRRLTLPLDEALLAELEAEVSPHHAAYELRSWVGPVPQDLVVSYGALIGTLVTEAPMGDITWEPQVFDEERIREGESAMSASGRTRFATVALDAAGEVVAYTEMVRSEHGPGRVFQWGTLVHPAHRGHRLGIAVKVRNHKQLADEDPSLKEVVTWNAEVNAHMIGVNERLGFVPTARAAEFEKKLTLVL